VKARLSRSLLMLYPRAWRERYSEELNDLSAELLAAGEVSRSRLALELTTAALAERAHSWNRTHTLAVLLGSVALIVVVAALLATNTLGLGGSTSARVTPVGWDSVSYRGAQVSFPPSFDTITAMGGGAFQVTVRASAGASGQFTFPATAPISGGGTCVAPLRGTLVVCLLPLGQVPPAYTGEQPTVLNGLAVYHGAKGDYYAPSLHVEVTASGPMAQQIVDTLTRNRIPGCTHAVVCASGTVTVG
jgi:hypothetical protein